MAKRMNPVEQAVLTLRNGELIGLPTETVYGLAGDAARPEIVSKIYALKNRPHFNPLIAHVASLNDAQKLGVFSETALALANAFWPGPLTLVVPVAPGNPVCDLARAGLDTQAIRWPAHALAQDVITQFGGPVVAPSANRSGKISPTRAEHVREEFGDALSCILDGGASVLGLESTVLAVIGDSVTLLRNGSLSRDRIEAIVGPVQISGSDDNAPRSPGMLSRHYSPDAAIRLNAQAASETEGFLAFGPDFPEFDANLSLTGDLTEAASNLYRMLREMDRIHSRIAIAPIPDTGLGEAINDRLRRAALRDDQNTN